MNRSSSVDKGERACQEEGTGQATAYLKKQQAICPCLISF